MVVSDCGRERHRLWHSDLGERDNECSLLVWTNDVAHDAACVSGIRQIRHDLFATVSNLLISKIFDQRWDQLNFEWQSRFEPANSRAVFSGLSSITVSQVR